MYYKQLWLRGYQIQTRFQGREAIHSAILSDPDKIKKLLNYDLATLTHRGPKNKVPTPTHCLVCWPEEGDSLSVVAVKKNVTPRPDDLAPDTFCKVKGLERYPCKVVVKHPVRNRVIHQNKYPLLQVQQSSLIQLPHWKPPILSPKHRLVTPLHPSLEQLQANIVSPIHADNPQDDPHNCSQGEGQGDEEVLKEDSDDGKITCMCISALDTLTFLLQVHIHVHVHTCTCTVFNTVRD